VGKDYPPSSPWHVSTTERQLLAIGRKQLKKTLHKVKPIVTNIEA
jgi:hypothetical protein